MTYYGLNGKYSWKREEKGEMLMMDGTSFCLEFSERDIWIKEITLKSMLITQ